MMNEDIREVNDRGLPFDEYTKSKIMAAAKTAGVAAILSLSAAILGFIGFLKNPNPTVGLVKEGFDEKAVQLTNSSNLFQVILSVLFSGLFFFLLTRFSTLSKKSIATNDITLFNKGLAGLASYFKIFGIIIIVSIGFALAGVLAAVMGAAFK